MIRPLGGGFIPKALSRHRTDAVAWAVGHTPHILCVIWEASLGSLPFRMISNPLKSVPIDFASTTLPPSMSTSIFK